MSVRPARRADIEAFSDMADKPTAKAWVGEVDGEVVALGGLALVRGRWFGFIDITEHGRAMLDRNMYVRAALIRAAVSVLREARAMGVRFIYADADSAQRRAGELLERLGFRRDPRSAVLYRWSATDPWQL